MSPRAPRVTASEVIRALERLGFVLSRQSGSHKIYKNSEGRRVTVPFHAGKILHPKVVRSIQEDAGLTSDEFARLLRDV
jgi:predicted RNA binding protein YcfA (HicA-like mRNA interferase family)